MFTPTRQAHRGLLSVALSVLGLASWAVQAQQACFQPPNSSAVNSSYQPAPGGAWWLVDQQTPPTVGNNVLSMDGPKVFRISSQYGSWTYIVGTKWGNNVGNNFVIYRTQDFRTFEVHMNAFNPSLQTSTNTIRLNNNKYFSNLANPCLYSDGSLVVPLPAPPAGSGTDGADGAGGGNDNDDGTDGIEVATPELPDPPMDDSSLGGDPNSDANTGASDPVINLVFSAMSNTGAPETNPSLRACFLVRIRLSDFLSWHTAGTHRYFADAAGQFPWQAWFGYIPPFGARSYLYDGGFSQGHMIPASGTRQLLGSSPGTTYLQDSAAHLTFGVAHNSVNPRWTWMADYPFVYLNSDAGPWSRVALFNAINEPYQLSAQNGWHIVGHATQTPQFLFEPSVSTGLFANNYSTLNPVNGLPNGFIATPNGQPSDGSVFALAPCAFKYNNRHYLVYSRNGPFSPAYQIVYRKTEPGQPFTSLMRTTYGENNEEFVLLRATTFEQQSPGNNFGNPEVFFMLESDQSPAQAFPYLVFRKYTYDPGQNGFFSWPMFKELTIDPNTGVILPLSDNVNNTDPKANITKLRIPRCR